MTKHRRLLAGRDPNDPPAATLVLAAIAALTGLGADGAPLGDAPAHWWQKSTTIAEVVSETGADPRAVRRVLADLQSTGAVVAAVGIRGRAETRIACPAIVAARWGVVRRRVAFDAPLRAAGAGAVITLLAGWVAGQTRSSHPSVRTTRGALARTLGISVPMVRRALAAAAAAGLIKRSVRNDRLMLWSTVRCESVPPSVRNGTGAKANPHRCKTEPLTGAESHPHRDRIEPPTGAKPYHATPFSPFTPLSPSRTSARGDVAALGEAAAEPEAEPVDEVTALQRALSETAYRCGTVGWRRQAEIRRRARALAETGLRPDHLPELRRLSRTFGAEPEALFATWLDRNQWRSVLDQDGLSRKETTLRLTRREASSGPLLAASDLERAMPTRRLQS